MENSQKRYWIVKVTEDGKWQLAIDHDLWLTQQRYEHQEPSAVTNLLNLVKQIKVGDWFILGWKKYLYAYGTVIDCPCDSEQKSSLNKVIDTNSHDYDSGIVRFEDSTVFYENLENGTEDWGQRINVDKWHYYFANTNITTAGVSGNVLSGISQMSIYEVREDFALGLIEKLRKQYLQNTTDYIDLLESNRNLILTGAPGTGKTYLAKQVAAQMILNKPYSERLSEADKEIFEQHCQFVQFHPSYDYTDFVEGLRPTPPDTNGHIGFERKDGVFKAFCRRALTNESLLKSENVFEIIYESVYKDIANGKIKQLKNPQYGKFSVEVKDEKIVFGGDERTENKENLKRMFDYYVLNNIFDLSGYSKEHYWELIAELTEGSTKKIDYTYYYGILQEMLKRADKKYPVDDHPFVFIIDEINRGEISKIFGELFFSIDPGYRGKEGLVQTQYQNMITDAMDTFYEGFYVPENVYIIGTMNDIDRSVECMDFAMRRRFAWLEVSANKNIGMLDALGALKDQVVEKMRCLNNAIWNEEKQEGIEGLNSSYHIGGAYFKKLELYLNDDQSNHEEAYDKLWNNHLKGLLFEYLRGMFNANDELMKLKDAYDQCIKG